MAGVIIGLSISTVALIRAPYNQQSVTNVYVSLGEEKKMDSFSDFQRLMDELHPNAHGVEKLSEELVMKHTLSYVVVMKDSSSLVDRLTLLNNTWAREISHNDITYFIPPKLMKHKTDERADNEEEIDIALEKNVVALDSSQMKEVLALKHVCREKLNSSKWYFISYDDVYVKTHKLEAYLQQFELAQNQLGYLGKPARKEQLCLPGPGSVLSFHILSELCPKLDSCMKLQGHIKTEFVLGECIRKLLPDLECNKEGDPQQLFVKFDTSKKGSILESKNQRYLDRALTVFPVTDSKLMYSIHQHVVSQMLNDSQHQLQEFKLSLDIVQELLPQSEMNHLRTDLRGEVSTIDDVIEWKLINRNLLMSDEEHDPALRLPSVWKNELNLLSQKAIDYLNGREQVQYTFNKIMNAYYKVDPFDGVSYVIDFEAKVAGTEDDFTIPSKRFWATLSRPYNPPEVNPVQSLASSKTMRVTIAVFLTRDELESLQKFMKKMERVFDQDQGVDLIMVVMRAAEKRQAMESSVSELVSMYETRYPRMSFKVIESPRVLARDHGISLVIRDTTPNDILFVADLDVEFDMGFIQRCRSIPLQEKQVYFPIMFAGINPKVLHAMNHSTLADTVSEHSGYWLHNSTTVACIYVADLLAAIQQPGLKGIPSEVNMRNVYESLRETGYEVVRGTDKGLRRCFSAGRECELDLYGERHNEQCESGRTPYEQLYVNTQLSVLLFDHEGEHSENKF